MTCFDCGKRKKKGIPVYQLPDGAIKKVCTKCWIRHYRDWMPQSKEKYG